MSKIIKTTKNLLIPIIFSCVSFFSTSLFSLTSDWVYNDKSKVRLISPKTHTDNQDEIIIGLEYELDPGWKTYWKSPGGGGFPQKIVWENSKNIRSLDVEWPTPINFEILGLSSIGYEEKVIFPLKLKLINKNEITKIKLNTNYLVCKHICIPGNADLYLEIPPGNGIYTDFFYDIEKVRSSLPSSNINLSELLEISASTTKYSNKIEIKIVAESNKSFVNPNIFIHTPFGLPIVKPINEYSFNLKKLNSKFIYDSNQFSENNFLIEITLNDKNHNYKLIKKINIEDKVSHSNINNPVVYILLISLVGGFILNLMPCVFPVLSIKLMSVLNNQHRNIRLSFFYTTLGILFSFLVLALSFLILRELQYSISWGMQFQEPYFLIFILIVITIFTLNTVGLFEIDLPSSLKNSNIFNKGNSFFAKNFFNGFFATLLATPCTAPFIGTAITAAFTQSSFMLFLIFMFMGLGMSLPYIVISILPKLIFLFPKPGKWMMYIKYILSVLLLLTIIWILNILLSFYNFYFVLIYILTVSFLVYSIKKNFLKYSISLLSIIILLAAPSFTFFEQNKISNENKKWSDFSDINIDNLIANKKLVFIDITADWCATCQFNKINVLQTKSIQKAFEENEIILVRADWTKPSNEIEIYLKKYNRFGIPFNAFFSEKFPNGLLLSEILSRKEVLNSIKKIK